MTRLIIAVVSLGCLPQVHAQKGTVPCAMSVEYGSKNQVKPRALAVRTVSGEVIAEVGSPAKSLGSFPACLGLFTQPDYCLIASVAADETGRFSFNSVRPGRYRLVARDPQGAFCVANTEVHVVRRARKSKAILIHLRPAGIDDCSYAELRP